LFEAGPLLAKGEAFFKKLESGKIEIKIVLSHYGY